MKSFIEDRPGDSADANLSVTRTDGQPLRADTAQIIQFPFPASAAALAGDLEADATSSSASDYFESIGTAVQAVVLRLASDLPRISVRTHHWEGEDGS